MAALANFIFYVSIVTVLPEPVAPRPDVVPLDKWRHFLAYGTLGYAIADWNAARWRKALLVITAGAAYDGGIEFGQSLLPQRYFGVGDFIANQIGAVLSLTWYLVEPRVSFVPVRQVWQRYVPNS